MKIPFDKNVDSRDQSLILNGRMPTDPRVFVCCKTCNGQGRIPKIDKGGKETEEICPECKGTGMVPRYY